MAANGFRDVELEEKVLELTRNFGIGAQFGGKYFCHDVRVIRLPRHGASLPIAIAVSCSADRQCLGKITPDGVFIEALETEPARFMPEVVDEELDGDSHGVSGTGKGAAVRIDLNKPMPDVLAELSKHPVKTRVQLNGPVIVARDIAHAKIKERLDAGEEMPQYLKDHPVYYAGPAKTPEGMASGSFGPTTAGRMDSYVDQFQAAGGSMVMLAKGNRSQAVTDACNAHGGFYLGSIGGPAARLAQDCIKHVEVVEYEEGHVAHLLEPLVIALVLLGAKARPQVVEQVRRGYEQHLIAPLQPLVCDGRGEVRLAAAVAAGEDEQALRVLGELQRALVRATQVVTVLLRERHAEPFRAEGVKRLIRQVREPAEAAQVLDPLPADLRLAALAVKDLPKVLVVVGYVVANVAEPAANGAVRVTVSVVLV